MHLWWLVGVGTWVVTRVYIVKSHISLLIIQIMSYRSIHGFHWQTWASKWPSRWLLWTAHHILFLLNYLMSTPVIPWNSRSLNCTNLAANSMSTIHHFVENFLLSGVGIGLVFFAYWHSLLTWIISNTEKVCTRVISTIWLRIIWILINSCHVSITLAWAHWLHLFHIQTRRLGWLPGNWIVSLRWFSSIPMPIFRLVAHVVI